MPTIEIIVAVVLALGLATACGAGLAQLGFPRPHGDRIGHVDSLRGYLGISVLCHHFIIWMSIKQGTSWDEPRLAFFNQLGKGSVGLFFMITGLVFYPKVLCGIKNSSWIRIYIKRILRITPLLFVSILLVTCIIAIQTGLRPGITYPLEVVSWISGKMTFDLMGYSGSKQINASVLWSIYYEWVFYFLILPFSAFIREFVGRQTWIVPIGLIAGGLAGRITGLSFFTYIPLFGVGMLAYELKLCPALATALRSRFAATVGLAALMVAMIFFRDPYGFALPLFSFFFLVVVCGNSIFGFLGSSGSLVLGECSYGTYLLHGIVLYVVFTMTGVEMSPLVALPALAILVTILTAITYLVVEVPGIIAGSRISKMVPGHSRIRAEATVAP